MSKHDEEYERLVAALRERTLKAAHVHMAKALQPWQNTSATAVSLKTGLAPATVNRYKKGKWGTRGPMLTTWLALTRGAKHR